MRLVRNITNDRRGKYAVIRMHKLPDDPGRRADVDFALRTLERNGMLEWGEPGTEREFFVIMLKDRYAEAALKGYAPQCSTIAAMTNTRPRCSRWPSAPGRIADGASGPTE
jgi:hypothetical protein